MPVDGHYYSGGDLCILEVGGVLTLLGGPIVVHCN